MLYSRRAFLAGLAGSSVLAVQPEWAFGAQAKAASPRRNSGTLAFVHLHTGERLSAAYRIGGRIDKGALRDFNFVLRDWRNGEVARMDVALLDLLVDLRDTVGLTKPFEIVSAYRSPKTNAMLAAHSRGVAKRSYHVRAKAIDIRLPGYKASEVYPIALNMRRGGVGAYEANNFIHVDTGPVRTW